jgi:hypothetical protein
MTEAGRMGVDADAGEWVEDRMVGVMWDRDRRRTIPPDADPAEVIALWMLSMFRKTGGLTQKQAVWGIRELYGAQYLMTSARGRQTLPQPILKAFKRLDPDGIVWSTHRRAWRPRQPEDPPGRRNVTD